MALSDYSLIPSMNGTMPGINMAEGMMPSAVNDGVRRIMADLAGSPAGLGIFTLEQFGAKGDGVTDDSAAANAAVLAAPTGSVIVLGPKTYNLKSCVVVNKRLTFRGSGSTIKVDPAYTAGSTYLTSAIMAFAVTANDVSFLNVGFDGNNVPAPTGGNTAIIWGTAARLLITGCSAVNVGTAPGLQCAFGSGITSSELTVYGCRFDNCPGAAFSQGPRPMFMNNRVTNPRDISFALNSPNCIGAVVSGNNINNAAGAIVSGHITAEEGASSWVITGNYIYGVTAAGIASFSITVTTPVEGGIIANNVIDGGGLVSVAPSALIGVTGQYRNVKIENNKLRGMASGQVPNAAITVTTLGSMVRGNKIDATTGTSSAGAIVVVPIGGDCYVFDNDIDCTTGPVRHIVVSSGAGGGGKLHIRGGRFIGGVELVNYSLGMPTAFGLWIENICETTATAVTNVLAALPAWGDREAYFNSFSAAKFPHAIKALTEMTGNGPPATGTFSTGDRIHRSVPVTAAAMDWYCTAGGSPGTWKAGGVIS